MARPPKKEPYRRDKTNVPKEGEWFANPPEILNRIDREGNLAKVLSIMFSRVEAVIPHGAEHLIYFDQDATKMVEFAFKTNMMQTVDGCISTFRKLADQMEALVQGEREN